MSHLSTLGAVKKCDSAAASETAGEAKHANTAFLSPLRKMLLMAGSAALSGESGGSG